MGRRIATFAHIAAQECPNLSEESINARIAGQSTPKRQERPKRYKLVFQEGGPVKRT